MIGGSSFTKKDSHALFIRNFWFKRGGMDAAQLSPNLGNNDRILFVLAF